LDWNLKFSKLKSTYNFKKMGNICGAAPSKDAGDQPIDRKSEQKKMVSSQLLFDDNTKL